MTRLLRPVAVLLALLLALSVAAAPKAPPAPVEGLDYVLIENGAPYAPAKGTVEVAEIFGYTCPHCAHFEPMLKAWRARQPAYVKFVAVPAPFGGWWQPYAKAYYAAQDAGVAEKAHADVFDAIHVEHTLPAPPQVADNAQIAAFYAKYGVDPAKFARDMESFSVQNRLRRAERFLQASGVDGTPALVVAGKYRVLGQSPEDALRIADALVAREHGGAR